MSRSQMYNPGTSEARSPWLAGLTEICNKLSGVLNMEVESFEDLTLPELFISEEDRFRIYEAPLGNKLWLQAPAPIIKKNGIVIEPEFDGFEIDYLGGSIVFNDEYICEENDIITASATYIVDKSRVLDTVLQKVSDLTLKTGSFQGSFDTIEDLKSEVEIGTAGYYAIVQSESTIYVWNEEQGDWVDVYKATDLSNYLTTQQINSLLLQKENSIVGVESTDTDSFYYGGSKTWVRIYDKILGTVLAGLVTTDNSQIGATDTLLQALGKLQAQINANLHMIVGNSEPTQNLVGEIGQDYVDKSSGKKYHLVSISAGKYNWEQYVSSSSLTALNTSLTKKITDTDADLREYVDTSISNSIFSSWAASY